jgi:hypothetical protein
MPSMWRERIRVGSMTTADADTFVEIAALDAAYDAGVEAALEVLDTFGDEISPELLAEISEAIAALQDEVAG